MLSHKRKSTRALYDPTRYFRCWTGVFAHFFTPILRCHGRPSVKAVLPSLVSRAVPGFAAAPAFILALILALGAPASVRADDRCTAIATGGTVNVITVGVKDYCVHAFTSVGNHSFQVQVPDGLEVDYLIVAGGGGGGGVAGGGGGAGGLLNSSVTQGGAIAVVVGAGGSGGAGSNSAATLGSDGENSSFGAFEAFGGGGGGGMGGGSGITGYGQAGRDGGSGGGGMARSSEPSVSGGSGSQGSNGGTGYGSNTGYSGSGAGGGGFSEKGADTPDEWNAGDGGEGIDLGDVFGTGYGQSGWFAGGGGGGEVGGGNAGAGGSGGGGGGSTGMNPGEGGSANTGGGGGGGGYDGSSFTGGVGGHGGSGIVIIRYALENRITVTGSPGVTIDAMGIDAGAEPRKGIENDGARLQWVSVGSNSIQVKLDTSSILPSGVKLFVKIGDLEPVPVTNTWTTITPSTDAVGDEPIEYSVSLDPMSSLSATTPPVTVDVSYQIQSY